jgi:hypothetical protein
MTSRRTARGLPRYLKTFEVYVAKGVLLGQMGPESRAKLRRRVLGPQLPLTEQFSKRSAAQNQHSADYL